MPSREFFLRPTRRRFLHAIGASSILGLAGCLGGERGSTGDGRADWPFPNFSPTGTSYNPRATGPDSKPTESWGVEVSELDLSRPLVFENTVYYLEPDRLRAFDVADGSERWSATTRNSFDPSMMVDSDHVYVGQSGSQDGVLALTHDGDEVWRAPTVSSIWAPIVRPRPDDDHLYAADIDGYVYRIRVSDGTVEWRIRVFGPVISLAAEYNRLVVGTEGGEVSMFYDDGPRREPTGLWRTKLPGGIEALALPNSSDVVAGAFGAGVAYLRGAMHAGKPSWHRDESSPHDSVVVAPDRVFSTDGSGLYAYDVHDGKEQWSADGDFFAPPAGAGNTIFVSDTSDDSGGVIAFDRSGGVGIDDTRIGARRWKYSLTGGALTGPTPAHDALFVVEAGGENEPARLVALRAE
ncbi:PQQ-binding-like beta-propeller repeat protein [Haloferax namakaokahaiae]|uniref:PQQ-binding-like beta-propeller repeat protein n=1 Tax=Haloferax namakaokahaiae TaxID=1748331 RepID=A0ABD5ZAN0_9EURY